MKNRSQKWLIIVGGIVLCLALIVMITDQFNHNSTVDAPLSTDDSKQENVVVNTPDGHDIKQPESNSERQYEKDGNDHNAQPNDVSDVSPDANTNKGAVSSDTEQTIQPDPVKPEIQDEAILTDPSQKPDGTPVDGTPAPQDHNNVVPPSEPATNADGGLPGFDNVPNAGENQVDSLDDMYENGNKIGTMG